MQFNFDKLKGKITECYGSDKAFAKAMGLAPSALSYRLSNQVSFRLEEVCKAVKLLGIADEEVSLYFFAQEVR